MIQDIAAIGASATVRRAAPGRLAAEQVFGRLSLRARLHTRDRTEDGARLVLLCRADLVAAMDPARIAASETARTGDPYGELAPLLIAREIDPLVADPERPAWTAWLAGRFADRLTPVALSVPGAPTDAPLRRDPVALAHAGIPGRCSMPLAPSSRAVRTARRARSSGSPSRGTWMRCSLGSSPGQGLPDPGRRALACAKISGHFLPAMHRASSTSCATEG